MKYTISFVFSQGIIILYYLLFIFDYPEERDLSLPVVIIAWFSFFIFTALSRFLLEHLEIKLNKKKHILLQILIRTEDIFWIIGIFIYFIDFLSHVKFGAG